MPLPLEIVGLKKPDVTFVWDEGHESHWSVRELRLRCHCAHCVSEDTGERLLDPSQVPPVVTINGMQLMGAYGVQIDFSDGHNTGIYRFQDLFDACPCDVCTARREAVAKR